MRKFSTHLNPGIVAAAVAIAVMSYMLLTAARVYGGGIGWGTCRTDAPETRCARLLGSQSTAHGRPSGFRSQLRQAAVDRTPASQLHSTRKQCVRVWGDRGS